MPVIVFLHFYGFQKPAVLRLLWHNHLSSLQLSALFRVFIKDNPGFSWILQPFLRFARLLASLDLLGLTSSSSLPRSSLCSSFRVLFALLEFYFPTFACYMIFQCNSASRLRTSESLAYLNLLWIAFLLLFVLPFRCYSSSGIPFDCINHKVLQCLDSLKLTFFQRA